LDRTITLDGNNFSSLDSFYNEVENKLTQNLNWKIGRNLNAFNDVLRGGFGIHDYENSLVIKWSNSNKSQMNLGWDETIRYVESKLQTCHPSNHEFIKTDLEMAKLHEGETLFELIVGIIRSHPHIQLIML
jgi:RNAse (barnase) inhibitor barstar